MCNKMHFHPSKCKALSITNQRNVLRNLPFTIFNYKLGSNYIDYVDSHTDLGVCINGKLLWKDHCEKLVSKASLQLGLLMRTCHFTMNKKQKRTFYLTVVRSIFEHCSYIWHPQSENLISKFDAIQKRAIKWINGRRFDHYSNAEYLEKQKELNILPIKYKFYLNDLILFYKIFNSLISIRLPKHFTIVQAEQTRLTRNTSEIIEHKDKTFIKGSIKPTCDGFRNSYFYRTMNLWNSVPYNIRQETRISTFKSALTKFLWSADLKRPD